MKIRRAKFLRTGMTYGVASGSTAEELAVSPQVSFVKDMYLAYLTNQTLPVLNEELPENPLEWTPCPDNPENLVYQEGLIVLLDAVVFPCLPFLGFCQDRFEKAQSKS